MGKTTSKTEKDTDIVDRLIGSFHYKTTISDGKDRVVSRGETSEESQKRASESWNEISNSDSGGSSGGSCCYITTACLDALGLPKDSLEMQTLKVLTREHILKSFGGMRDYVRYGRVAPGIVERINTRSDAQSIWNNVYSQLQRISGLVLDGKYEEGYQSYRNLVVGLEHI